MARHWFGVNWWAAVLMGIIVSTYSTILSQFAAARIGRDAAVDWMVVAAIPLRDGVIQTEPGLGVILAGVLFHQWADFSWAVIFFGLLGRWTGRLRPRSLALVAVPWALFTSSSEWLVLVPLLPFWQPIFTLNQPYWIGAMVHVSAAALYPLFPYVRDWAAGHRPSPHRRFAAAWAAAPPWLPRGSACLPSSVRRTANGHRTLGGTSPSTRPTCGRWRRIMQMGSNSGWSRWSGRRTPISAPWPG
jgi:hypothetical protein